MLFLFFSYLSFKRLLHKLEFAGGINLSQFIGDDVENSEGLMGLNAGLSFSIINIGPVSIVPEVYYAEKKGPA